MKKKILLTGGSGFIGRNLRESALAGIYDLHAPPRAEMNLADGESVDSYFKGKSFDAVIHSAVKPGHRNAADCCNIMATNVVMFENLRRHKDKYGRFINLGSGSVYDPCNYSPKMKEERFGRSVPEDQSAASKYLIAREIEKENNFVDLRLFGVYGKYEDWEIRFISNALCKALYNMPITIKQDRKFDYIFVEDLPKILEFFVERDFKHKAYNITPDKSEALSAIAHNVKAAAGNDVPVRVAVEGAGSEYSGDNSRIKEEFTEYSLTPLGEGIKKLCSYYKESLNKIDKRLLLEDK